MFNLAPQKVLHLYKEEEKKKPNTNYSYIGTIKKDGWYTFVDYHPELGFSNIRNENREIPSMMFLKDKIASILPKPSFGYRLIMEAYIPDTPFHVLNGIFNRKSEDAIDVRFAVHDLISINHLCEDARTRLKSLSEFKFNSYGESDDLFTLLAPFGISDSRKDWFDWFDQALSLNEEGIVLKQANGIYQPDRRNSSLMKIKCEEEADLLAIDYYSSKGEKGNEAWNLSLTDKEGNIVNVRVGKDSDITKYASNSPIGKVHQIKYMKKIAGGGYREPVYIGQRYDKTISEID